MEIKEYKKNTDAALDADFEAAAPFGKVKVGQHALYWKAVLRWRYARFAEIRRIYRRVEEVRGKTGCCSNDFSVHKLVLTDRDGNKQEVLIGESLYRHEPERLMEYLAEKHPEISYGKVD